MALFTKLVLFREKWNISRQAVSTMTSQQVNSLEVNKSRTVQLFLITFTSCPHPSPYPPLCSFLPQLYPLFLSMLPSLHSPCLFLNLYHSLIHARTHPTHPHIPSPTYKTPTPNLSCLPPNRLHLHTRPAPSACHQKQVGLAFGLLPDV